MAAELVGRDAEVALLLSSLESSRTGSGKTVMLSGEAGIGKTQLVEELAARAKDSGFRVLSGSCMPGISSAFMPFREVLKSGGLENLAVESIPKVICAYLTNNAGLLIGKYERGESGLDADIFSSMLTAVNSFVQDSLSMLESGRKQQSMNRLGYGDYTIIIESASSTHLAVIIDGRENEFLIQDMRDMLAEIKRDFGTTLAKWQGDIREVSGTSSIIAKLVTSGKYDGTAYAADDPKLKHNLLMENVTRGIIRASEESPLLIIIDNLHWADSSSLALLHYLSRNIKNSRILITGAYRPEEILALGGKSEHPLAETLRLMSRDGLYIKMELGRFSQEDVGRLVDTELGEAELPEGFIARVYKDGEGNPLFVLELLKLLVDESILDKKNGAWVVSRDAPLKVPSRIFDIIMRRVSILPVELREILDCASVVGLEFTSSLLEPMVRKDKITLLKAIRELESSYRLVRSLKNGYAFDHIKVRDVLYQEIPQELRREYHGMIAKHIEETNRADLAAFVPALAHHYSSALDAKKSIEYLQKAADAARKDYANKEAVRHYMALLGFLEDSGDDIRKLSALDSLADVYSTIGEYGNTVECCGKMISMLRDGGAEKLSGAYRKKGIALFKNGDNAGANRALELALETAKKHGPRLELARVYLDFGWILGEQRDTDRALKCCMDAALILEEFPDAKTELAKLYNSLYVMYHYRNDAKTFLKYAEKSLKVREELQDKAGIAASYNAIGRARDMMGDNEKALEWYEKSVTMLEKIGDLYGLANAYFNINLMKQKSGEYLQAIDGYMKSIKLYEKLGDKYSSADAYNNIGNAFLQTGDYEKAIDWHGKNLWLRENLGDENGIAMAYANIGEVFIMQGMLDKAQRYVQRSLEMAKKIKNPLYETYGCNLLAECYLGMHDTARTLTYANRALELSTAHRFEEHKCASYRLIGGAHAQLDEREDALENFEKSVALCKDNGIEYGRTCFDYGKFLIISGEPVRGRQLIENAATVFKKIGNHLMLKQAQEELARLKP